MSIASICGRSPGVFWTRHWCQQMLVSTTNVLRSGQRQNQTNEPNYLGLCRSIQIPQSRVQGDIVHRGLTNSRTSRPVRDEKRRCNPLSVLAELDIAQLYSKVHTIGADSSYTHHPAEMLHGGTAQSYRSRSKRWLSAQHCLTLWSGNLLSFGWGGRRQTSLANVLGDGSIITCTSSG